MAAGASYDTAHPGIASLGISRLPGKGSSAAFSAMVDLSLRAHGELVGPVVSALVRSDSLGVPLDLLPPHLLMALRRPEEPLPQIPVRHRLFAMVEPTVLSPLLVPAPSHAVDEVGGVGVDGHRKSLVHGLQRDACGGYLHPQVSGVLLAAADLLDPPVPVDDNGPVAPGTAGAGGRSVGVDLDFLLGQGRWPSAYLPSTHSRVPPPARVPSSRTIR